MKIDIKQNNNELTIILEGRLDTNSVTELENKVSNLEGIEKIIFDFEKLEYISSSGLRFVLKCKKTVSSTKVINCNTDVYEIFSMTGFAEMMEVEKAYRKISVENCEQIGEGFYGKIYRLDDETIVKLYKIPDALDMIKKETELSKRAFVMGIPTAIPYDIVKVDDSYGAVFELLNAKPVADLIKDEESIEDFAKKSVKILKDIHKKEVEQGEFPNKKETTINELKGCKNLFSEELYNKLLSLLESIPETNTLLHSDFHIKNTMFQNDELLLIDMETLSIGHPIFEFSAMYACYIAFSCIDKQNTDKFFEIPLEITTEIFNKTLEYYYEDKTKEDKIESPLKTRLSKLAKQISKIGYIASIMVAISYLTYMIVINNN